VTKNERAEVDKTWPLDRGRNMAQPMAKRQRLVCFALRDGKYVALASAEAPPKTSTLKIGTRGSPLAMAQAYLTKQLLQVQPDPGYWDSFVQGHAPGATSCD
jgi:hypothetical protein